MASLQIPNLPHSYTLTVCPFNSGKKLILVAIQIDHPQSILCASPTSHSESREAAMDQNQILLVVVLLSLAQVGTCPSVECVLDRRRVGILDRTNV